MAENIPPSNTDGLCCLLQVMASDDDDDDDDDDFIQAPPMKRINVEEGILLILKLLNSIY